jgi:hypothetical protein
MKSDCLTCQGSGKILVGVVHGNPESDVCPICDGKGYICDHQHVKEAYNGGMKLVNGEASDDSEYVGLWCSDCGQEIDQRYLDYVSGKDKLDPRD